MNDELRGAALKLLQTIKSNKIAELAGSGSVSYYDDFGIHEFRKAIERLESALKEN